MTFKNYLHALWYICDDILYVLWYFYMQWFIAVIYMYNNLNRFDLYVMIFCVWFSMTFCIIGYSLHETFAEYYPSEQKWQMMLGIIYA